MITFSIDTSQLCLIMAVRYALFVVIFLCANTLAWSRIRSRKARRLCYLSPKPLVSSIKKYMNTISELQAEIGPRLDGDVDVYSYSLSKKDFINNSNTELSKELMSAFTAVRCFAMRVNNFFSKREIKKLNDMALSLTEINRNPSVCVFDSYMTDCRNVDTKDTQTLYAQLQRQWVILDVLLQKQRADEK